MQKWVLILLTLLLLSGCTQKDKVDNTGLVVDPDSELISLLLNREDFDSNWKLIYGEVNQNFGGTEGVNADEHAYYFIIASYLPYDTYFTLFHGMYLHVGVDFDTNIFFDLDREGLRWSLSESLNLSDQPIYCIEYSDSTKQSCVVVENDNLITSVLRITNSSNLTDDQVTDAVAPIIKAIDIRHHAYINKQ